MVPYSLSLLRHASSLFAGCAVARLKLGSGPLSFLANPLQQLSCLFPSAQAECQPNAIVNAPTTR